MPSEAEWEYAAKASTELPYAGSNVLDDVAWYRNSHSKSTMKTAIKEPNQWGLYDMSGNVYEWCNDQGRQQVFHERAGTMTLTVDPHEWKDEAAYRISKGGFWASSASSCRVTHHYNFSPKFKGRSLGFRICRYVN